MLHRLRVIVPPLREELMCIFVEEIGYKGERLLQVVVLKAYAVHLHLPITHCGQETVMFPGM